MKYGIDLVDFFFLIFMSACIFLYIKKYNVMSIYVKCYTSDESIN